MTALLNNKLSTRSENPDKKLSTRSFEISPKSFNEKERSFENSIVATENPVMMPDYDRGEYIPEILLMSGLRMSKDGSLPLQNCHQRGDIFMTLGSIRELKKNQKNLEGKVIFSTDEDGEKAMIKAREGHVKYLSIGYHVYKKTHIPEKTSQRIDGKDYAGPLNLITDWEGYEGSMTPFPADNDCEMREIKKGNSSGKPAESNKGGSFRVNEKLKQLLIQRGLAQGSTAEEALAFLSSLSSDDQKSLRTQAGLDIQTHQAVVPDEKALREAEERGIENENKRQNEIRSMCQVPGCEGLAEKFCSDRKMSVEQAGRAIIEHCKTTMKPVSGNISGGVDERDKFREAAEAGLSLRSGLKLEKPIAGANEFRGMTLLRFAEECLVRAKLFSRGFDPSEIAIRAMSTSDFPLILANVAGKAMQKAYAEAKQTWAIWCNVGSGVDFKDMSRPQFSESPGLELVNEKGEYNEVAFKEFAASFAIKTYGAVASITRQMILNNDMATFIRIPKAFGNAAQRKIGDLVYNLITANTTTSTVGTSGESALALFIAAHNNLINPGIGLGTDSLSEIRRFLRLQTGPNGVTLNNELAFVLAPPSLETNLSLLATNMYLPEKGAGQVDNIFKGTFTPVIESRLETDSATAHYGVTDSNQCETVEVAFLNGQSAPMIQQTDMISPDCRKIFVRLDVGVGLMDHRGFVKNPGA